jgi:hypothetical protein
MARTLLSAAKVKQYRQRLGLQQRQAAKLAGWQRGQSWYKLEHVERGVIPEEREGGDLASVNYPHP